MSDFLTDQPNTPKKNKIKENNMKPKESKIWNQIREILSRFKPIMLSHHPLCEQFENHTLNLFGKKYCIGCFIGYPSGILMLVIGLFFDIFSLFTTFELWIIGFTLFSAYLLSIFNFFDRKALKIVQKIVLGIGAAFIVAAILSNPGIFWVKLLISFTLIQFLVILIGLKRIFEIRKICKECMYESDWKKCPGLKILYQN
ncbi:MAG: EscU/YscU/HrcU family type III secretion system export apparatus switch protein [archaeon]|nr:EscU/YscU/HrcU family type III secretion system export apparatus switch protein [archaeon]